MDTPASLQNALLPCLSLLKFASLTLALGHLSASLPMVPSPSSSPPSSQVSSTAYDETPHWCILVTTYTCILSNFPGTGDVWFSLNGTTYQNNSNVILEDIGDSIANRLLCKTNLTACCRRSNSSTPLGNWIFPNGTRVGNINYGSDFYRVRGHMVVRLNRRRGGVEGIYRCEIPDSTNVTQTIYIGVYTASTGE